MTEAPVKRMKALSRKRSPGRPRKDGPRFPSGDRKPDYIREESEREARSTVLEARMKHQGVNEETAKSDLSGHLLGRLHLHGKLSKDKEESKHMMEAGLRFGEDVRRHSLSILMISPTVQAQNLLKARGMPGEDDEQAERRNRRIIEAKRGIDSVVIMSEPGIKQTMLSVCVEDNEALFLMPEQQLNMLRRGLRAMRMHYGIGGR